MRASNKLYEDLKGISKPPGSQNSAESTLFAVKDTLSSHSHAVEMAWLNTPQKSGGETMLSSLPSNRIQRVPTVRVTAITIVEVMEMRMKMKLSKN
jgi:hypothetical protein